jgi:hypothetical protein
MIVGASCGVPTGDSSFEEIDSEVLGGINNPTTTSTTTSTTTTTTIPTEPDPAIEPTTTTVPVTEPPPATPVAIYFISRGSLSPITRELDPQFGLEQLIVLLEDGPPSGSVGVGLESYVEEGLIVGTPVAEGGVLNIALDPNVFDAISPRNQREAFAQIVLTFLENRTAVGQVAFTIDGDPIAVPTDGGSKSSAAVDDFSSLFGTLRSSAEPQDGVDPRPDRLTPTSVTTTSTVLE